MAAHHNVTGSAFAASYHSCSLFLLNSLNDQSFSTELGGNSATFSAGSAWRTPKPLLLCEKDHLGLWRAFLPRTNHTEVQAPHSTDPACLCCPPMPSSQAPCPATTPWSMQSLTLPAPINLGPQQSLASAQDPLNVGKPLANIL